MNGIRDNRRCGGKGGFTLIEMMIALAILGIALTAIFSTFIFQQKSFVTQNTVAQMQQSVRGGMAYMESDLRNAASVASTNINVPAALFGGTAPISLVSGLGVVDGGATGSDNLFLISFTGVNTTLQKAAGNSVLNQSDTDVDDVTGWVPGDMGIIFDSTNADVFFVTGVQISPTKVTHNPAGSIFSVNKFSHDYAAGTRIARIRYSGYSIDSSTPAHPALVRWSLDNTGTRVSDVVAEDIEDMQILLGVQDNVTHVVTEHSGDWFTGGNAAQLANVRQVRIQLVGRSPVADAEWNEGGYYYTRYNRTGGLGGYDHHRRRPLEEIIHIRNAGL